MQDDFIGVFNQLILPALKDTLYMVAWSSFFAIIIGLFLGIVLFITKKDGIKPIFILNKLIDLIVNIGRSIPFVILLMALFPLSKFIVGTTVGTKAAVVALTIASIPFVARVTNNAFSEIDNGVIEAAMSFGSSNFEIIFDVLIPETAPAIINSITLTIISIIGYSAMAGTIGGGGLGDIAIRYGLYRGQFDIIYFTIIIMVVLVQLVQFIGNIISSRLDKR